MLAAFKSACATVASAVGMTALVVAAILLSVGAAYWLWVAIKLGSFVMFAIGFMGPAVIVTAPVGVYMLLVGIPQWVLSTFG